MGEFAAGLAQGLGQGTASLPQAVGFREERKIKGEQVALTKKRAESEQAAKAIVGNLAQAGIDPADRTAVLDFVRTQAGDDPAAVADALSLASQQGLVLAQTRDIRADTGLKGAQEAAVQETALTERATRPGRVSLLGKQVQKVGEDISASQQNRALAVQENRRADKKLALAERQLQFNQVNAVQDRLSAEKRAKLNIQGQKDLQAGRQKFQSEEAKQAFERQAKQRVQDSLLNLVSNQILSKQQADNNQKVQTAVEILRAKLKSGELLRALAVQPDPKTQRVPSIEEAQREFQKIDQMLQLYDDAYDLAVLDAEETGDGSLVDVLNTALAKNLSGEASPDDTIKTFVGLAGRILGPDKKKKSLIRKPQEITRDPFDLRVGAAPQIVTSGQEFAARMLATYGKSLKKGNLPPEKVLSRAFEQADGDLRQTAEILSQDPGIKGIYVVVNGRVAKLPPQDKVVFKSRTGATTAPAKQFVSDLGGEDLSEFVDRAQVDGTLSPDSDLSDPKEWIPILQTIIEERDRERYSSGFSFLRKDGLLGQVSSGAPIISLKGTALTKKRVR